MDENINKHLHDILNAINEIESFFGDKPKYFNEFCNDLCLRRAVERDIEIIGEAMNRILKENRNIAITNSRKIVDARNYIIHGYDSLIQILIPFKWANPSGNPYSVKKRLKTGGTKRSCTQA